MSIKCITNIDDRGVFQELFKVKDDFGVKQVSLCTINPNKVRGNHWHKKTTEVFIVTEGIMNVELEFISTNLKIKKVLNANTEENKITITPGMIHTVSSEEGCKFLILSDKIFDPNDPDTFR